MVSCPTPHGPAPPLPPQPDLAGPSNTAHLPPPVRKGAPWRPPPTAPEQPPPAGSHPVPSSPPATRPVGPVGPPGVPRLDPPVLTPTPSAYPHPIPRQRLHLPRHRQRYLLNQPQRLLPRLLGRGLPAGPCGEPHRQALLHAEFLLRLLRASRAAWTLGQGSWRGGPLAADAASPPPAPPPAQTLQTAIRCPPLGQPGLANVPTGRSQTGRWAQPGQGLCPAPRDRVTPRDPELSDSHSPPSRTLASIASLPLPISFMGSLNSLYFFKCSLCVQATSMAQA